MDVTSTLHRANGKTLVQEPFTYASRYKCYISSLFVYCVLTVLIIGMDSQHLNTEATSIFQSHTDTLSQCLIDPVKVSQLLFSKRCIDEPTLDKMETLEDSLDKTTTLFSVMLTAISSDQKKLKVLATVLSMFEETKMLSEKMISEYGNHCTHY